MSDSRLYDLLVIGGGPGGSTLATLVAMQGHSVVLVERESAPAYKIGESLLPSTMGICELLGVRDEIDKAGFMPKNGGYWYWGSQEEVGWEFGFGEVEPLVGKAWAYQVERLRFDPILLNNARRKGVDVREGHRVEELLIDPKTDRVTGARITEPGSGATREVRARHVADASGHTSPFHSLVGTREYAECFRNLALFCYFRGGKRRPPPNPGNIINVTFDKGWFWYIPLKPDLTSVGAVISAHDAELLKDGHEAAMSRFIGSCPMIKDYLAGVERVTEGPYGQYRVRKDWSYCNTRFWRPGLALIGDSACFIDPLFSSGVHLSTYSALLAARSINTLLRGELDEPTCFGEFEERYRAEYYTFFHFLSHFYDRNRSKEEYFTRAHELLPKISDAHTERQSFVRLVAGMATKGCAVLPPVEGRSQRVSDADIGVLARFGQGAPIPSPGGSLVPSQDGLHWALPQRGSES